MRTLVLLGAGLVLAGCVSLPYEYGWDETKGVVAPPLADEEAQFYRGTPNAFLDGLGHYVVSLPTKLLLLNWDVDNHDVSPETEAALRRYLAANDLHHVKVLINDYSPGYEWRRLFHNDSVGAGWRYTLGVLSVAMYTILPGRVFGGDHYNPYTNTIHIYSDDPGIVVHEGAHAKDFADTKLKGTYAAVRILPVVPLWQEGVASSDALSYFEAERLWREQEEGYEVLYPAYGTYVGGEVTRWVAGPSWVPWAIQAGAVIPGHIIGRIKAAGVPDEEEESD